jgi:hypothetical protein
LHKAVTEAGSPDVVAANHVPPKIGDIDMSIAITAMAGAIIARRFDEFMFNEGVMFSLPKLEKRNVSRR